MKIQLNQLKVSDISLILCCFSLHFLIALDMLIIVPFSASIALDTGVTGAQAGYLTAAYALSAAVICLVIKGSKNANHERKRILLLLTGVTVTTLLASVLNDFYLILFTRLLTGIFGGALAVVNLNYLLLVSSDNNRKKNMAILLSAFPLALALGVPLLLFSTSATQWQLGFQLLGSGFICISILFTLSKHCQGSTVTPPTPPFTPESTTPEPPATNRVLQLALLIITSAVVSTFVISTQYPVMLITTLDIPSSQLSLCYTISGLGSFLAVQTYARMSVKSSSISSLIALLSIAMIVAIHLGFNTLDAMFASITFTIFVIASSVRTLIITTELISSLGANTRTKIISLQSAIQHFAVGLGSTISSTLITLRSDSAPDFTQVIAVATVLIMLTPILWWVNNGSNKREYDKAPAAKS
ncbi:MFS transporter [Photobacterium sanguinicancri]|uniref:MFS transporter n=1 Tax=Photobacterium sanguinicancri TaxID=875932 RepID=A0AAW7Y8R2_9GAMM|nr:MFS transporter [Photobacterium sanguinicancri]MDO6544704.1 MFS transporter [Photobacterium sanguinicancri]